MPWMSKVFSVMILSLARSHSCPGVWLSTTPLPLSPPTGACAHQNKCNFPGLALPQTYFHREMEPYLLLTYQRRQTLARLRSKPSSGIWSWPRPNNLDSDWLDIFSPVCLHLHLDLRVSPYKAISCISCFFFALIRWSQRSTGVTLKAAPGVSS